MNADLLAKLDRSAALACAALGSRFVAATPLQSPDNERLIRIDAAIPATAEPLDYVQEFITESEVVMLPDAELARSIFCTLWRRAGLAGLVAMGHALNMQPENLDDCGDVQ